MYSLSLSTNLISMMPVLLISPSSLTPTSKPPISRKLKAVPYNECFNFGSVAEVYKLLAPAPTRTKSFFLLLFPGLPKQSRAKRISGSNY